MKKSNNIWFSVKKSAAPLLFATACLFLGSATWSSTATASDQNNPDSISSRSSHHPATILFIDAGVQDAQELLAGVAPDTKVVRLRSDVDGVEQITHALKEHRNLDGIQIISHGAPGRLMLGASLLSDADLGRYRSALQAWSGSLKAQGGVLLYGCNVAQGAAGSRFVEHIGKLIGAPVAASTDATGAAALGGNWELEKQTGNIAVASAIDARALSGYRHLLALPANGTYDVNDTFSTPAGTSTVGVSGTDNTQWNSSWSSLTYDGGTIGGWPTAGIFRLGSGLGDYIDLMGGYSSNTDANTHWFRVTADNVNVGSFQLTDISLYNFNASDSFDVTIIGYKLGGGTVQGTVPNFAMTTTTSIAYALGAFSGVQLTAFDVAYARSAGTTTAIANFTFTSFGIANAQGPVVTPIVSSITPNQGPTTGGTSVTITGANFTGTTAVTIGGVPATGVTVVNPTTITATTPAGTAGAKDVVITNASGSGTGSGLFTYVVPPTVTGVAPNSGPLSGNTSVVITGTNLSGVNSVSFGATATTSFTIDSPTQITAVSPATGTAGVVDITVVSPGGGSSATSASDQFTYMATPTVTGVTPINGPTAGGTSVVITGTNFSAVSAVKFGATAATSFTVNSATQITAISPAGAAGIVDITVTTPGGTSATGAVDGFTYTTAPSVTGITPNGGPTSGGTAVTITGTNFTGATAVTIGGVAASGVTIVNATTITATTPAGTAGAQNVAVTTPGGSGTGVGLFTYATVPGVPTGLSATAGNTQATINFTAPASDGGATITGYTATSNPGGLTGTCVSTPCTVTGLTNGTAYTFTVTATNSAGTSAASTASNSVTPKAAQTITFNNPGAQNFGTSPVLTATASSGLAVSFTSSTTSVCTITVGGTLTLVSAGACTITADQAGSSGWLAAPTVSQSFAVNAVVPGAPTGATATAGNAQASIAFTAPVTNGGATITGYTVTSNPGSFTGTCATSPCIVTGLSNGTAYTFTVTASNSAGTGAASTASNSVSPIAGVPAAPTSVTATAGNAQATINFTVPASDGGAPIASYTATSNPGSFTGTCAGPAACTITVAGLTNGTTYTFTVTAANSSGSSAASTASAAVTPAAPQVITFANPGTQNFGTTPTLGATASSGLAVSFTSSTTAVCNITAGGVLTFVSSGTCTINAEQTGNTAWLAAPTVSQSFTVNAVVPGAPTGVTATAGNTQANIAFTAPASNGGAAIIGYTVTSSPSGVTGTCASSPCTVSGLSNGTAYTFVVTASNSAGTSAASSPSGSVTPLATVPGTPTAVSVTAGNGEATISFTTPAFDGGAAITSYTATSSPGGFSGTCAGPSACAITVAGLNNGTAYTFTVTATNSAGTSAASSPSSSVTPLASVPGVPTGVTATPGNGQVTVNFTAPGSNGGAAITSYTATSSPGGLTGSCAGPSACAITVAGLTNGTAYTFAVAATNSAGTGAASAASNSVTPTAVPVAAAATMQYQMNSPVTLDLAPFITGTSVNVVAAAQHGTTIINGTQVTYLPAHDYFGSDTFSYVSINGGVASAPAVVTVTFNGVRPDPTKDTNVSGLVTMQMATAKRFWRSQIANYQQRMESLHRSALSDEPEQASVTGTSDSTSVTVRDEQRPLGSPSRGAMAAGRAQAVDMAQAPAAANDSGAAIYPNLLASSLATAAMTSSINLNMASLVGNEQTDPDVNGGMNVWGAGNVRIGKKSMQDGPSDIDYTTDGVSLGSDRRFGRNLTLGIGIGYARDTSTIGTDGTKGSSSGNSVALYGSYQPAPRAFVDGLLGYGVLDMSTKRYVASVNDYAKADRTGSQVFASLAAGLEYRSKGSLLSPYARYDYALDRLDATTESGAGVAALYYSGLSSRTQQISLGLRGESHHTADFGSINPRVRVEYQHHIDGESQATVAYADLINTQYDLAVPTANSNSLLLGLGSGLALNNGVRLDFDYQWVHSDENDASQAILFRLSKPLGTSVGASLW